VTAALPPRCRSSSKTPFSKTSFFKTPFSLCPPQKAAIHEKTCPLGDRLANGRDRAGGHVADRHRDTRQRPSRISASRRHRRAGSSPVGLPTRGLRSGAVRADLPDGGLNGRAAAALAAFKSNLRKRRPVTFTER
jgi:hypothetical protein